jgi:hypothetical protein
VQSPLLKDVLGVVLEDYPGVTTSLKRLIFQAPFNPFIHRWNEFLDAIDGQQDDETRAHLQLLHDTLHTELRDLITARADYIANKVITYEHLFTIFIPGASIYTSEWNRDCAAKFKQGAYCQNQKYGPCYQITCQKINWDGEKFGCENTTKLIPQFAGTMKIGDMPAVPLEFHPDHKKIRAQLIKRGKLFEQYHGYHYKAYRGFAIGKNMCGEDIKVTVDSRIIIDTFAYGKFNPNSLPYLLPLKLESKTIDTTPDDSDEDSYSESYHSEGEEDDDDSDAGYISDSINTHGLTSKDIKRKPLTEEQLLHCTPLLKGYALKSKRWLSFFIDAVSEISFNSSAFDSLVLPENQKELILAFAESQVKHKDAFDDVISGKGRGIIMLLSGGPGIGKTLTAESVAENMKVPLYMMSAGDLGIASSEVEATLSTILEMVAKWNAVLLLDECDVFLEARSAHDLERNKIVSIFLRTLEYYEGILFLTTNRVRNMDPAFQSRIHISMEYPALDFASRSLVWANFLNGIENEIAEAELPKLAEVELNGRQIKNVLKTAGLLARHKGVKLRYEHLRTVLDVEIRAGPQLQSDL